ncbi:MAG: sigma-70 family RNA polymerase sigma factor [Alphaproteobacteria bacterium]|nr:sigma-70 family RNA polymerase sigma factor [Alphaproteobacteria bacterium]
MAFVSEVSDLLPQHVPALRRYARALTGDGAAADDLVQDCVERALTRAHLWRQPGNLRAWLFTIMHNINANERRRAASRPRLATIDDIPEPAQPASQIGKLMASETFAALKMLSMEHRQVLLLVALEGLQYAEVAEVLGVPVGTVMSRLSRARDRLTQLASGERAAQPRSVT